MDQSQPHFTTVGQLIHTNPLKFSVTTTCMEVAIALLSSHLSGGPVLDEAGRYLGFVSEFDLLHALDHSQDLKKVTTQHIMSTKAYLIHNETPIKEAIRIMEEKNLLNLCVEEHGVITKTFTRHDLLRGYLGVDLGIDEE
ncbi:MAG: CBS domain-containing protein [Nitrospirales bacterium]|nr:CBS domain-containing protein [Nitrospirales bacterium]